MSAYRIATVIAIAFLLAPLVGCSKGDQVNAHLERAGKLLYEKKSERARVEIDAAIKLDPSRTSTYRAAMSMYEARRLAADKARIAELALERVQESKLAPMPPKRWFRWYEKNSTWINPFPFNMSVTSEGCCGAISESRSALGMRSGRT